MKYDMAGLSVMLAMPTHRDLPPETVLGLLETQAACAERGILFRAFFGKGSSLVHHARSKIAYEFLTETDCNRIFWIDSDMAWTAGAFLRLLALSTVKDVVAASYPFRRDNPGGYFIRFADQEQVRADEHGCVSATGLGLGFTVIQRHVMEELSAKAPKARFPDVNDGEPIPYVFRMDIGADGSAMGEDYNFFADVRSLGYTVSVDPMIELGHIGPKVFRGRLMEMFSAV